MFESEKYNQAVIKYYPAQLSTGKEWVIYFYVLNPYTLKLERIRKKINRIKNLNERRKYAKTILITINEKLASGWNPFLEKDTKRNFITLKDGCKKFTTYKYKELEKGSIRSYKSFIEKILQWEQKYHKDIFISEFDRACASDFMLMIRENPKISSRTYNNHLKFYRTLFNWFFQFDYTPANPFEKIPMISKRHTEKKRKMFTRNELYGLFSFLEKYPAYRLMCALCYYCLLRPKDITHLKSSNFDLKNHTIFISKEWTKNDKDSFRVIPSVMDKYLSAIDWEHIDKDFYIFGDSKNYSFLPSKIKTDERKIAKFWDNTVRPVMKWDKTKQFYSLKDSGITNFIADGITPTAVQQQADHSSLEITSIYTHLGTPENYDSLRNLPQDITE